MVDNERWDVAVARARAEIDLGRFYVVDFRLNAVIYQHTDVDLEAFGRELGVLAK